METLQKPLSLCDAKIWNYCDIFPDSDDSDRTNKSRKTSSSGTLNRDDKKHLCYLYTNSDDGKVKVWLSFEWCWDLH